MSNEGQPWVDEANVSELVDLYELTMVQAYWREGMLGDAVFSLYPRRLPRHRNYLIACGLDDALRCLEGLRFGSTMLDYLSRIGGFREDFLKWLGDLRFTGEVRAVPEGTPVFADEPWLEVMAPLPQAQIVETVLMNQIHFQTVLASKASRVVQAARGRKVVDFGLRRMHGADAGIKAARAFHVAGVAATSNVLAGRLYGIPVTGTMAHSYVQAHDREDDAFREWLELYPESILLVDTYDTIEGVRRVVELARRKGGNFRASGVRLDSGDLGALAFESRRILDEAGLRELQIFASGGLDEQEIAGLVAGGAPIDGFGVGTGMGVSDDAPALDAAYKLTHYAGRGRLKLSPGKPILPGAKQVFRIEKNGVAHDDVVATHAERRPGRPLLRTVMREGRRTEEGRSTLAQARERARAEVERLPARIRSLDPADPPYPVRPSKKLRALQQEVIRGLETEERAERQEK